MGALRSPLPAKLFIGILSAEDLFQECETLLKREYGATDYETAILTWDGTNYYREEMGSGIKRKFIFFKELIDPGTLSEIKIFTNNLEARFAGAASNGSRRRLNLDPGYVTEAKVVLATTKDFPHRVYIGKSIYAEATLRYSSSGKTFMSFDHTYPDYRTETYRGFFNEARDLLRKRLNQG